MKLKTAILTLGIVMMTASGSSAVVLNSSEGVNVNVTLNNRVAEFNSTGLNLDDNDLYYFENQCGSSEAVDGVHPNGTLKCTEVVTEAVDRENLSETLAAGNVSNASIDMDSNDIINPGKVDGINLDNPGTGITVNTNQFEITDDSITDTEISNNALSNSSIASSGSFTLDDLEILTDLTGSGIVNSNQLASNSVTSTKINTGAVTDDKISGSSINSTQIENSEVTSSEINTGIAGGGLKGGGGSPLQSDIDGTLSLVEGTGTGIKGSQAEWNNGDFNFTTADRKDNGGEIGIGYLNGTNSGQANDNGINTSDMIGYWRMDRDVSGDGGTVFDYSGSGYDGTTSGGTEPGAPGTFGTSSMRFDGYSSEHVDLGNNVNFNGESLTISAWIYPTFDEHREDTRIISKSEGTSTSDSFYNLRKNGWNSTHHTLTFRLRTDGSVGSTIKTSEGVLKKNEWNHVVATYDGSEVRLYVDGNRKLSESKTGTITTDTNNPTYIGDDPSGARHFGGNIDEVMLLDSSVTDSEVQELYFNGKPFEGNYTSNGIDEGTSRNWDKIYIDADVPSQTSAKAEFRALDSGGNQVDSQLINLQSGGVNYSLSVSNSEQAELFFNGTSSFAGNSWEINEYQIYYADSNVDDKPLGVASGGIGTTELEDNSVTGEKIDGPLNMQGETIRNLPFPNADSAAATKEYVDEEAGEATDTASQTLAEVLERGNIANTSINMNGTGIQNLQNITADSGDVQIKDNLDLNSNRIKNVPAPTNAGDAVNKSYVDNQAGDATSAGKQTLSEVLEQGSTANQTIDMDGNDLANTGLINGSSGQNIQFSGSDVNLRDTTDNDILRAYDNGSVNIPNGKLDLGNNQLTDIGSTDCNNDEFLDGQGDCESVSSAGASTSVENLSKTLQAGNVANQSIDMSGKDIDNINQLSGDSSAINLDNNVDLQGNSVSTSSGEVCIGDNCA